MNNDITLVESIQPNSYTTTILNPESAFYKGMFVSLDSDGSVFESMYGDVVIGFTTSLKNHLLTFITTFPWVFNGYWKDKGDGISQFYKDRLHPTNKYRKYSELTYIDEDEISVSKLIEMLTPYNNPNTYASLSHDFITVYTYEEWEELNHE